MKGPDAFRTISEAASELGVPQHVLRFWETKFSFIRPMKRAGGRRFYRRQDLDVLRGVRILLHDEGYTIKGVQKLHKEQGVRRVLAAGGVHDTGESLAAGDGAAPHAVEAHGLDEHGFEGHGLEGDDVEADGVGVEEIEADAAAVEAAFETGEAAPFERPLLGEAARRRLASVLGDLEGVKARLDALLADGDS